MASVSSCKCPESDPKILAQHHKICLSRGVDHINQNPFCHDKRCGVCRVAIVPMANDTDASSACAYCMECSGVWCAECTLKANIPEKDRGGDAMWMCHPCDAKEREFR